MQVMRCKTKGQPRSNELKIDNQLLIYNRCTNSYQLTTILFKKTVRYGEYHLCSKLFEELSQEY